MEKTKLFERDYYNEIIEMAKDMERQDIIDFCNKKINQINNKNAKASAKNDKSYMEIADMFINVLIANKEKMTISEMLQNETIKNYTYADGKEIKNITNQKASAILNSLATPGENCKVAKITEGRKVYFKII